MGREISHFELKKKYAYESAIRVAIYEARTSRLPHITQSTKKMKLPTYGRIATVKPFLFASHLDRTLSALRLAPCGGWYPHFHELVLRLGTLGTTRDVLGFW